MIAVWLRHDVAGATLLICPAPILGQWQQEVERHVHPGGLRVAFYAGARHPSDNQLIRAASLSYLANALHAELDMIVVCRLTLSEDVSFVAVTQRVDALEIRSFRGGTGIRETTQSSIPKGVDILVKYIRKTSVYTGESTQCILHMRLVWNAGLPGICQ